MSLLGLQSFKSPHYLNDQYHANFCILPADQIKKRIEENQKKEVCTGEMGKRQTTQFTTELWNFMQTDFGQGQPTSGRLLSEMMREEETHGRPWVRQELDSSHGALQRYASLSPQSTAQVSRLRDYTRTQLSPPHPFVAPRQGSKSGITLVCDLTPRSRAHIHPCWLHSSRDTGSLTSERCHSQLTGPSHVNQSRQPLLSQLHTCLQAILL